MSIFGAMTTSVSGLRAQSYALENISGNIANSQTVGFKRVDSSFSDLIPDYPVSQQVGGSVGFRARGTNTLAGNYMSSGVPTNMAIAGDSFFVVRKPSGYQAGGPMFSPGDLYTRRGDFALDKDGYVVNGAGAYLMGTTLDPTTGAPLGAPNAIRLSAGLVPAKAATTITFKGNLPVTPKTANYDSQKPGSDRYTGSSLVTAADETAFKAATVAGGSVTVYDGAGSPTAVNLRWAKTADNTWNLYYENPAYDSAVATSPKWIAAGQGAAAGTPTAFTFDAKGALTAPTGPTIPLTGLTIGGTTLNLDIKGGVTQYNDTSSGGGVNIGLLKQDGFAAGTLNDVSVTSDGRLVASYSNGVTVPLAQVAFAHFNDPNALKREDGSTFSLTLEAGLAMEGLNGGAVMGGRLEGSNTDMADEFSKMIVTQQAYSANTRVITTAQQMLQDAINIVR